MWSFLLKENQEKEARRPSNFEQPGIVNAIFMDETWVSKMILVGDISFHKKMQTYCGWVFLNLSRREAQSYPMRHNPMPWSPNPHWRP